MLHLSDTKQEALLVVEAESREQIVDVLRPRDPGFDSTRDLLDSSVLPLFVVVGSLRAFKTFGHRRPPGRLRLNESQSTSLATLRRRHRHLPENPL